MHVLLESPVKAAFITVAVFTLQLLLAPGVTYGQTNRQDTAAPPSASRVSHWDTTSTNRTAAAQGYLPQLRNPVHRTPDKMGVAQEVDSQLEGLEWTGQYVERYIRVPQGNTGQAKLIKFLIPVYREQGTQRKVSVGAEDKRKN